MEIDGVEFENCTFEHVGFQKNTINNVRFKNCNFFNTNWTQAKLNQVKFEKCNFEDALFTYSDLSDVGFKECSLPYSNYHFTKLHNVNFEKCEKMLGTSFLGSLVKDSKLTRCNLENVLFFDTLPKFSRKKCAKNSITLPTVGLLWDIKHAGYTGSKVWKRIKERKCLPVKLDYTLPHLDHNDLDLETKEYAHLLRGLRDSSKLPEIMTRIAKQLSDREMKFAVELAKTYAENFDSLILPGGDNIPKHLIPR